MTNSLFAWELKLGAMKGCDCKLLPDVLGADGHNWLPDLYASDLTLSLTESVTHTGLKSISAGATEHLVDAGNMPRMDTHTQMESVLSAVIDEVLVARNPSSLKGFRAQLL
jgi:hypothetical protein